MALKPASRPRPQGAARDIVFGSGSGRWRETTSGRSGLRHRLRQASFGLAITAVGMAYLVSDRPALPLALLGGAVGLLALAALAAPRELAMWVTRRPYLVRLTNTLYSAAGAAVVVAAVGLVGRGGLRWDLAAGERRNAAEETVLAGRALPAPPEIRFYPPPDLSAEELTRARDLLDDLAARVPGTKIAVVDPVVSGAAAREGLVAGGGVALVRSGGRSGRLAVLTEDALRDLFERLARGGGAVCSLAGHGERDLGDGSPAGLTAFVAALERGGRAVRTIEGAEELAGCDVVVVAGPTRPLPAGEVEALQARLDAGGRLLVLLEPGAPTGLEPLLRAHGVDPLEGTLEEDSVAGRHVVVGAWSGRALFGPRATAAGAAIRMHGAVPLAVLGGAGVALTGPGVRAEGDRGDRPGPFALAASTAWRAGGGPGGAPGEARLFVLADADVASNAALPEGGNESLVLAAVDWLGADLAAAPGAAPAARAGYALGDFAPGAWAFVSAAFLLVGLMVRRSWGRR